MNNTLSNKIATLAITVATMSVAIAHPAQAISFNFNWQGNNGYSAQGMFGYDETTAPAIISESGSGATNDLDFLMVSFFSPGNTPIVTPFATYNTVVGGVSQSPFFKFNFDTISKTLFGALDIGGGTGFVGEQFLQGTIGTLLELKQDVNQDPANPPTLLDQNSGVVTVTPKPVPEPSSILGLLALGAIGAGSLLKKKSA